MISERRLEFLLRDHIVGVIRDYLRFANFLPAGVRKGKRPRRVTMIKE
jgi:hypothetical protein